MEEGITIGLDLAKRVFQAHGASASGAVLFRKKLRREQVLGFFSGQPRCRVAMEACASAHYWGRAIAELGHEQDREQRARRIGDRARLRQTLRQAPEERHGRRGGNLRRRATPDDAIRGRQE